MSAFEEEPGQRSVAKQLTKDEARRIAANTAAPLELKRLWLLLAQRCEFNKA